MSTEEHPHASRELVATALLGEGAECAQIGISIYDDQGMYVAVNQYACELLGYERHEILQHDVADFTKGGIDRSVLRSPERREGVRIVTRKDGTTVPVAFIVVPTRVADISFYISVWWELAPDDPRVADAQ